LSSWIRNAMGSARCRLTMIPNWHFFTGPAADLEGVWNEYRIWVHASCGGAIAHSSIIYFIAPDGTKRYITAPMDAHLRTGLIDLSAISRLTGARASPWSPRTSFTTGRKAVLMHHASYPGLTAGRRPARVTVRSRCTAARDRRPPAAVRACRQ